MDTPEQITAIFAQEERIGRRPGELWPDTGHTTDDYIAFLRRVPTGTGLIGVMATWANERRGPIRDK